MINIGIGIGWAKAIYSVANNIIANFKARVATYPNSIFEAGPCLDTTLEELNAIGLLDNASLVITPNAYNEGKLYDVVPNTTLGDMDVVRATTATRVNSAGLIEVVPRNLLTQSNTFSNANWNKVSVTVTSGQNGYDGTNNAWLLASTSTPTAYLSQSVTLNANSYFSVYLKKGSLDWAMFLTSGTVFANFDLLNGVVGSVSNSVATIENVGNGWFRCSMKSIISGTNVRIYPANADNTRTITGNILIQNSQLEDSATATTYFPTTTRLNIPRIDYTNGTCPSLLVEPQRTNATLRSDDFGNAYWGKFNTTITTNNTTAPDGAITADKIVENTVNSFHSMDSTFSSGTGIYTASIYAKVGERRYLRLNITEITPAVDHTALFDLQTGTLLSSGTGVTASIINAGNGWYRIILTSPALVGGQVRMAVLMQTTTSSTPQQYLGNGTSGLFIWGAQLETGSYATSYIPTVASTVTRNADVISKTGISSLIGQTEGTMFVDFKISGFEAGAENRFAISDGTGSNWIFIGIPENGNNKGSRFYIRTNSTTSVDVGSSNFYTTNSQYKIALAYKNGDWAIYCNGALLFSGTDTIANPSSPFSNLIYNGSSPTPSNNQPNTNQFNSVQLYKTRLTNSELAQLTTL